MSICLRISPILLIISIITAACSSAPPHKAATPPSLQASPALTEEKKPLPLTPEKPDLADESLKEYTIAEPDSLYISVWKEPELTITVKVRPDG
ncbi:MAG: hypothetical protein HY279_01595, partial [Nitrospinae bacterium]|nr:hypothetical protein [Nitrospinota bacterium]